MKTFSPAETKKQNGGKQTREGVIALEEGEAETERKSRAPGGEARIHPERREAPPEETSTRLWRVC